MAELEVLEYENDAGKNSYARWVFGLGEKARAKVLSAIALMKAGNFGDVKPVGQGVSERRIHWGSGLRIYFGKEGQKLVLLLGGGTKRRQDNDIKSAQNNWAEHKKNKRRKNSVMGRTRPYTESIKEMAEGNPKFRAAVLAEASELFLGGEIEAAKIMLRDFVNATIGFQELGKETNINPKNLMRMLSEKGNPTATKMTALLVSLQQHEGIRLEVRAAG